MATPFDSQTFAKLIDRGVLQIGDGHRAKLSELGGDGPIFLRAGLLSDSGIRLQGADRFRKDVAVPSAKVARARDTFVTTKGNSVGRTGYIPPQLPQLVYSPHLSYWRSLDRGTLHPEFLRYWASSPDFVSQLHAMAHGTDMAPYLSLIDQKRLVIRLPSIHEQRYISRVLGALDDKIDSNRQLAGLLEETAATLFRAQFVDFVGIKEFVDSELGRIPAGWTEGTVRDLSRIHKRVVEPAASPQVEFEHFSIPAYDLGHEAVLEAGRQMLSAKSTLPDGDCVLLSKLNPATKRVWWPRPSGRALPVCSPEFLVLEPLAGVPNTYLYAVCAHDRRFYDQVLAHATGTTGSRQRVKPSDVMVATVLVPSPDCLAQWDQVVGPMFDHAHALASESRTLASIRHALLPRLVSGEIRVSDSSDPAEVIEPLVA